MKKLKDLLKELSYDNTFSDFAAKVRADRMKSPDDKWKKGREKKRSPKMYSKINRAISQVESELTDLRRRYRDLAFELEQTAEPEGGPIADRLAKEMEPMEKKIKDLESKRTKLYKKLRS